MGAKTKKPRYITVLAEIISISLMRIRGFLSLESRSDLYLIHYPIGIPDVFSLGWVVLDFAILGLGFGIGDRP